MENGARRLLLTNPNAPSACFRSGLAMPRTSLPIRKNQKLASLIVISVPASLFASGDLSFVLVMRPGPARAGIPQEERGLVEKGGPIKLPRAFSGIPAFLKVRTQKKI